MHPAPWIAGLALAFTAIPCTARDIDVIQPGDEALTCPALSAQMNGLMKQQSKERRKAQGTRSGLFAGVNRVAMPVLDGVVSQTGGVTMGAADGARQALRGAEAVEAAAPPPPTEPGGSLVDQRLARLSGFHTAKQC